MKHTNTITPRSLDECHFQPHMAAIEKFPAARSEKVVMLLLRWVLIILAVAAVAHWVAR